MGLDWLHQKEHIGISYRDRGTQKEITKLSQIGVRETLKIRVVSIHHNLLFCLHDLHYFSFAGVKAVTCFYLLVQLISVAHMSEQKFITDSC